MIIENSRLIREIIHNTLLKHESIETNFSINKWLNCAEKHGLLFAVESINKSFGKDCKDKKNTAKKVYN